MNMQAIQVDRKKHGFTLVEIMIIVALIGLLAVLAIPSFIRGRKQSQGRRIVNDARIIDAAVDSWAMEAGKSDGDAVDLAGLTPYSKSGNIPVTDVLGNAYGIGPVGTNQVRISVSTKTALAGVGVDWASY